ncbi:RNA polymerase sigma factor [Botrimarina colliarenosi]|uniref:RNA polymerase sigma factor n=2 Tax=Botrimarina colliarenosi TaxID=2528001 RepID=A0A5C5ZZ82_9BACT|nr:RNA polymerase sigma factor [Botrimarina colliarenosi]
MLVARHGPRVRAFAATLVGFDTDVIDEVMQATLLVAWKKIDIFRYTGDNPAEEFVRWVCTIARFEVLGYLRDKQRRRTLAFDEAIVGELAELQEQHSDLLDARHSALRGCLKQLEPKQQEALRMRYGIGLSMSEIAARQSRTVKAATVAMCRVRKALERCIRQSLSREGIA